MKKFRSLMIEGHLPDNTSVQFNFSESWVNWATASQLANATSDYAKILPNDLRIPINQRARGLTFRLFRTEATKSTAVNTVQNTLNISRLTTLWSYTGRGSVSNNPTYGRDSQPA